MRQTNVIHHFWVLTNSRFDVRVKTELHELHTELDRQS